jgi:hypothetical protein
MFNAGGMRSACVGEPGGGLSMDDPRLNRAAFG